MLDYNDRYRLDYGHISVMKEHVLKKASRYLATWDIKQNSFFERDETSMAKERNALKLYLLFIYSTLSDIKDEQVLKNSRVNIINLLEYLVFNNKQNDNDYELAIEYLMKNNSAARYYLILFKMVLHEALQKKVMLCEIERHAKNYLEEHEKKQPLLSLQQLLASDSKELYPEESWKILNRGLLSHRTRDLLYFFEVNLMISRTQEKHDIKKIADDSEPLIAQELDIVDIESLILEEELVKKYDRLSALAHGYKGLSYLSPQDSFSSRLYRKCVDYSEMQKAKKKALQFCVNIIEGRALAPEFLKDITEEQKIELYLFLSDLKRNRTLQPYITAFAILLQDKQHEFWKIEQQFDTYQKIYKHRDERLLMQHSAVCVHVHM